MNAKEFLQQIKKLNRLIENKLIEVRQLKEIANNAAGNMTGEKVQATKNPQRIAEAICKYVDLENEINADIDRLIDTRKNVIGVIEQLNPTEYDIIHKIYVQNLTLQDVADKYDKTYSWVTTVHGRALKNVQKILNKGDS